MIIVGNTIQRMILWELMKVFIISLIGITGILLLAGIIAEATQQGLGPGQILKIIPLLIPSTLPYTIPTTTLFATCVVYGRLAHDNEILAIRASGVSLTMVVRPAMILGLATTLITMTLYFNVIPYTHHLMRSMFLGDVEGLLYTALNRKREMRHPQLNYEIYVKGMQGRKLINPTFKGKGKDGKIDLVSQAREAELTVDKERNVIRVYMVQGQAAGGKGDAQGLFFERIWEIPVPENLQNPKNNRARDLMWKQLIARKALLTREMNEAQKELDYHEALMKTNVASPETRKSIAVLKHRIKSKLAEIRSLETEMQMRPALAIGCLFFVLVGCPVGIWFSRSDYLSSFITCFLPIVLIYYPLVLCGTGLAKEGHDPILTVWSADIALALLSLILFWRLLKN